MTDRERLINLMIEAKKTEPETGSFTDYLADYLLEHGVTVPCRIQGYEDYYVDEVGNVYSTKTHKYVSQQKGRDGYYYVQLCKDGIRRHIATHRLVAKHYVENPSNYPVVNHKDENRENNESSNLEWCTEKYNTNYGNSRTKHAKAVSKSVVCIETGEVFLSQKEAGQSKGIAHQHICDCCKGKNQTCGGYHWRYTSREEAEQALKEREKTMNAGMNLWRNEHEQLRAN